MAEHQLIADPIDLLRQRMQVGALRDRMKTAQRVETSPLEAPQPKRTFVRIPLPKELEGLGIKQPPFETAIPEVVRSAADAGVVFDQPAPAGQFLSSLAINDDERVKAYAIAIKKKTGVDIKTRRGPDTEAIEYFNLDTKRWNLAVPPGSRGIESFGGLGIVVAPELAGALIMGTLTKSTVAIELGAAGGAFAGEIYRLRMGQSMGINQNATDEQIMKSAAIEAGIAAASGAAMVGIVKTGKFILDAIDGRIIPKGVADDLGLLVEDAQDVADQINEVVGAERFRFNLAQASNDEDLLAMADLYKRSREYANEFGAFTDEQVGLLEEFYSVINKPYRSRVASVAEAGEAVQQIGEAAGKKVEARQDKFVQMKQAELDEAITSLRTRPLENLGPVLREVGNVEQEGFRAWAKEGAIILNELAGDAEFITNDLTFIAVRKLDERISRALFTSIQKPQRTLIGAKVTGQEEIPENIRILRESMGIEVGEFKPIINKLFDPDAKFTFLESWEAISALKRVERVSSKGLSTDAPEVGAVRQLIKAMEGDLRESASHSSLREAYENFITRYRREKTRLDSGIVADIMEQSGGRKGRFRVANEDVFRTVFTPSGKREATELFALIGNDPEAMRGMRESIHDFYKRAVLVDGRPNINRHRTFMRNYAAPMKVFFTKEEVQMIARTGGIEKALQAREAARKTALEKFNRTYNAELRDLKPGKMVKFLMDADDLSKAHDLVKTLAKTPDILRGVQAEFRKVMSDRIRGTFGGGKVEPSKLSAGNRPLSAANLDTFLNGKGGERGFDGVISALYGSGYIADLQLLNKALKIAAREPRFPNRSNTAFWVDTVKNMTRTYVGLFTRAGRVVTAIDKFRGRAVNRVLMRAILNPSDLAKLIALRGIDLRTKKAAAVIGAMGGTALLEDFESEPLRGMQLFP